MTRSAMAGPKLDQWEIRANTVAQGSDLGGIPFFGSDFEVSKSSGSGRSLPNRVPEPTKRNIP